MIDRLSHVPLIIISSHIMAYVDDHDQTTIYCISRHYRTINDTTTKSQVVPEISESKQLVLPIVPLSLAIDGDDENDAAGDMTLEVEKDSKGNITLHNSYLDYINRPCDDATNDLCLYQFVSEWIRVPESQVMDATIALRFINGWQPRQCCVPSWDRSLSSRAPAIPLPIHNSVIAKIPVLYAPSRVPDHDTDPIIHCKLLLVLFRPWRSLTDLLSGSLSWTAAYNMWYNNPLISISSYSSQHIDHLLSLQQGQKQQLERRKLLDNGTDDGSRDDAEHDSSGTLPIDRRRRILAPGAVDTTDTDGHDGNDNDGNGHDMDDIDPSLIQEINDDNAVLRTVINGITSSDAEADYVRHTASLYTVIHTVPSSSSVMDGGTTPAAVPVVSQLSSSHPTAYNGTGNGVGLAAEFGLTQDEANTASSLMKRTYQPCVKTRVSTAVQVQRKAAVAARTKQPVSTTSVQPSTSSRAHAEGKGNEPVDINSIATTSVPIPSLISDESLPSATQIAHQYTLNTQQQVAYYRIAHHLRLISNNNNNNGNDDDSQQHQPYNQYGGYGGTPADGMIKNKQLLMAVLGPGGTGKTRVIQAVQALFDLHGMRGSLRLAAFMGQPASKINGQTLASMLHLRQTTTEGDETSSSNHDVQQAWSCVSFLIIDEVSLVGLTMLARLNDALHKAKPSSNNSGDKLPFAGINVIFFGDFVQFPPIGDSGLWVTRDAKSPSSLIGQNLWSQLTDVVILQQQMRQSDTLYGSFLERLRSHTCTRHDVDYINTRVINQLSPQVVTSFQSARTICSRQTVRDRINMAYCISFAKKHHRTLYVVEARDVSGRGHKSFDDITARILLRSKENGSRLPSYVPLVEGMRCILRHNVAVECGLFNGSEGVVLKVVLDVHEQQMVNRRRCARDIATQDVDDEHDDNGGVHHVHGTDDVDMVLLRSHAQPLYVLCYFPGSTIHLTQFGLPVGVVPIYPEKQPAKTTKPSAKKKKKQDDDKNDSKTPLAEPATGAAKKHVQQHQQPKKKTDDWQSKSYNRIQIPLVPGCAMTDYGSQGQTMSQAIIDCGHLPHQMGPLTSPNVYVPLSRLKTLDGLMLLRPLTMADLSRSAPNGLAEYLTTLDILVSQTRLWVDDALSTTGSVPLSLPSYHHDEQHPDSCYCSTCCRQRISDMIAAKRRRKQPMKKAAVPSLPLPSVPSLLSTKQPVLVPVLGTERKLTSRTSSLTSRTRSSSMSIATSLLVPTTTVTTSTSHDHIYASPQLWRNGGNTCGVDSLMVILHAIYQRQPIVFTAPVVSLSSHHNTTPAVDGCHGLRMVFQAIDREPPSCIAGVIGSGRSLFYRLLRHNYYQSHYNMTDAQRDVLPTCLVPPTSIFGAPTLAHQLVIHELLVLVCISNHIPTTSWLLPNITSPWTCNGKGNLVSNYSSCCAPITYMSCSNQHCEKPTQSQRHSPIIDISAALDATNRHKKAHSITLAAAIINSNSGDPVGMRCISCDHWMEHIPIPEASLPSLLFISLRPIYHDHLYTCTCICCLDINTIMTVDIGKSQYHLAGIIFYDDNHFWCECRIHDKWYIYDDLSNDGCAMLLGDQPAFRSFAQQHANSIAFITALVYCRAYSSY
jgi:hypothetical protein